MRTLIYIEQRKLVNYARMVARSPKRLIPILFVALAVLQFPFHIYIMHSMPANQSLAQVSIELEIARAAAFLALIGLALYRIYVSLSKALVGFGMSEIDFLFPTPIPRSTILTLKLVKLYGQIAVYTLFMIFMAAIMGRIYLDLHAQSIPYLMTASWPGLALYAILLINVCTVINLASSFRSGSRWWLPTAIKVGAYALPILVLGSLGAYYLRTGDLVMSFIGALENPIVSILLLPARWTTDLIFVPYTGETLHVVSKLTVLGALAVISFVLVLLRRENPYEPSLSVSIHMAALQSAVRSGDVSKIHALKLKHKEVTSPGIAAFGRGAVALVWKDMNVNYRIYRNYVFIVLLLLTSVAIAAKILLGDANRGNQIPMFVIGGLSYAVWIISTTGIRNFRADSKRVDILKPMPISPWKVVAASGVTISVYIVLFVWLVLALTAVLLDTSGTSLLLLAALVMPFMVHSCISLQIVIATLYPSTEDVTQNIIAGLLSMSAAGVSLGVPLAIGAVFWQFGVGTAVTTVVISTICMVCSAGSILLAGYLYKRFDPTGE